MVSRAVAAIAAILALAGLALAADHPNVQLYASTKQGVLSKAWDGSLANLEAQLNEAGADVQRATAGQPRLTGITVRP